MMKKIEKMVYGELWKTFVVSLLGFNMLLMVEKLLRLSKIISGVAGFIDIIRIILLLQPQLFIMTIPIALLMAVLLSFGRMNIDNEILAMKGGGLSFTQISKPVIRFGILTFLLTLLASTFLGPMGNRLLRDELNNLIKEGLMARIEDGMFNGDIPGMVIYVKKKVGDSTLRDIFISQKENSVVMTGESGRIEKRGEGIVLTLKNGMIQRIEGMKSFEIYFREYSMNVPLHDKVSRRSQELYPHELLKRAEKSEGNKRIRYLMEFHRRFIFPLFNIIISFIGPPLGLLAGRTGRLGGFTMGIAFITLFYMVQILFQNLAETGRISPSMGAWSPFIIFFILSVILFVREQRR